MTYFDNIDLLIDNPDSWLIEYAPDIVKTLATFCENVSMISNSAHIQNGDILFILSCDRILNREELSKHTNNIVIHAGDLPKEKGWSPWSWQIEQGKNEIVLTLFEAIEKLDSGSWYLKDTLRLTGYELIDEIRKQLVCKEIDMIETFLKSYPMVSHEQVGEETFFPKRGEKNQQLDINQPIVRQFNTLRVCDNERYPAHFYIDGHKYIVKIYPV